MQRTEPTFVHAWWRSGSTYIWSKLRQNQSLRCYYEPLHERIAFLNLATLKEPEEKIARVSRSLRHPIPKEHYFAEYADLLHSGKLCYFKELAYDNYLLKPAQTDDTRLAAYLEGLISAAFEAERRPVLCFCRSQMRSAWMRKRFGGIHIAQIRNPFDQWTSFQVERDYFVARTIAIALNLRTSHPRAFAHIDPLEALAQQLAIQPSLPLELAFESVVPPAAAGAVFLILWIASSLQAIAQSDFVVDIDLLSGDPAYRKTMSKRFHSIGCPADFSDCSIPISKKSEIRSAGFEAMVEEALTAIRADGFSLIVSDAHIVKKWLPSLSPLSRWIIRRAISAM